MESYSRLPYSMQHQFVPARKGEPRVRPGDNGAMIRFARRHVRAIFSLSFITTLFLVHAIIGEVRCSVGGGSSFFWEGNSFDVGNSLFRNDRKVVRPIDNVVNNEPIRSRDDAVPGNVLRKNVVGENLVENNAVENIAVKKRALPRRIDPNWTDDEEVPVDDDLEEWKPDAQIEEDDDYYEYDEEEKAIDEQEEQAKAAVVEGPMKAAEPVAALGPAKLNDLSLGKEKFTDQIKGDKEDYFRKIDEYKPWIDPHTYRYKLNPKGICRKTKEDPRDIFLVIFVNTAPGNFLKRVYMRNTFGQETAWPLSANESMRMVFSIGATKDPKLQAQIYQESEMFGDIVQEDFIDHYWNMTLKSIMGFKWVTIYCQRATFAMKMDDDVLLNTPLIYKILKESPTANFTMGDVLKDLGPVRDKDSPYSKFYTPKHVYREDEYPPFYGGSSYIMSTDVVEKTYYMALKTPLIPWSDVFIGICYNKVGITPGHRHLFRQNARFKIAEGIDDFRMDDERLTYLKQHMTMYHLTITHSKMLWDIWTESLCKLQCVKPTPKPAKRYRLP